MALRSLDNEIQPLPSQPQIPPAGASASTGMIVISFGQALIASSGAHPKRTATDELLPKEEKKIRSTGAAFRPPALSPEQEADFLGKIKREVVTTSYGLCSFARSNVFHQSLRVIKTADHGSRRKKPISSIKAPFSRAEGLQLLGNFGTITAETARSHKRVLNRAEIIEWLGMPEHVHPVGFSAKVWCRTGSSPSVYAWATYESLEVRCEANSMTLKFQTSFSGSGVPEYNVDTQTITMSNVPPHPNQVTLIM
jgi:hypothetical protein